MTNTKIISFANRNTTKSSKAHALNLIPNLMASGLITITLTEDDALFEAMKCSSLLKASLQRVAAKNIITPDQRPKIQRFIVGSPMLLYY